MKAIVVLALVGMACAAPSYVLPHVSHGTVAVPHAHAPVAYAPAPAVAAAPAHPLVAHVSRYHAQDELGQVNYGFAHPGQAKNEYRDAYGNVVGSYSYIGADNKPVVVYYTAGRDGFQVKSNALPTALTTSTTGVSLAAPHPVMDTPEVIAARKEFEAAFAAAAAAAETGALPEVVHPEGAPSPVMDTPEVAAAKEEFIATYNAAAAALATVEDEAPVTEVATEVEEEPVTETEAPDEVYYATEPAPVTAPVPVVDTEEVAAAKESFQAAYDAAAAAAAAGTLPEVVVSGGAPEVVTDTAEVAEAKARFQAAYNAAAAAAEAAPDYDLDGSLSRYSGYLSAVDGSLSPLYTNTLPFGAYGYHAPVVHHKPHVVHAKLPAAHVHAHGPFVHAHGYAPLRHTHGYVAPHNYATPYNYVHA